MNSIPSRIAILAVALASLAVTRHVIGAAPPATPFNLDQNNVGVPIPVPGVIECEQFDRGGYPSAVWDTTSPNTAQRYRPEQTTFDPNDLPPYPDVDRCDDLGGGYALTALTPPEYLMYTIQVPGGQLDYSYEVRFRGKGICNSPGIKVEFFQNSTLVNGGTVRCVFNTTGWTTTSAGHFTFPGPGTYQMKLTPETTASCFLNYATIVKRRPVVNVPAVTQQLVNSLIAYDPNQAAYNSSVLQALVNYVGPSGARFKFPMGTFYFKQPAADEGSLMMNSSQAAVTISGKGLIEFEGAGKGLTIFKAHNRSTVIFYLQGTATSPVQDVVFKDMTFEGVPERSLVGGLTQDYSPGGSWTFPMTLYNNSSFGEAIVMMGYQDPNISNPNIYLNPVRRVRITNCSFVNQTLRGIYLRKAENIQVDTCDFEYFSGGPGSYWAQHPSYAVAIKAHVGILATMPRCENVHVINNTFNGNKQWTTRPLTHYDAEFGADGLAWLQSGGNFVVSGNLIKNYNLEGIQVNAGPAVITENTFDTISDSPGAVAVNAYDGSPYNRDTGILSVNPTLSRSYFLANNSFTGGTMVIRGAPQDPNTDTNVPRWDYTRGFGLFVNGNRITLIDNYVEVRNPGAPTYYNTPTVAFNLASVENGFFSGNTMLLGGRVFHCGTYAETGANSPIPPLNLRVRCCDFTKAVEQSFLCQNAAQTPMPIRLEMIATRVGRGAHTQHLFLSGKMATPAPTIVLRGADLYYNVGTTSTQEWTLQYNTQYATPPTLNLDIGNISNGTTRALF